MSKQKVDLALRLLNRATGLIKKYKYNEALETLNEAVKAAEASQDLKTIYNVYYTRGNFAQALRLHTDALKDYEKALQVADELFAADPEGVDTRTFVTVVNNNLGALHRDNKRPEKAKEHFERALKMIVSLLAEVPDNGAFLAHFGLISNNLGELCSGVGESKKAGGHFEKGLEAYGKLLEKDPGNTHYQACLGTVYMNLGLLEGRVGKVDEAKTHLKESLKIRGKLLAGDRKNPEFQKDYDLTLEILRELRESGRLKEAN